MRKTYEEFVIDTFDRLWSAAPPYERTSPIEIEVTTKTTRTGHEVQLHFVKVDQHKWAFRSGPDWQYFRDADGLDQRRPTPGVLRCGFVALAGAPEIEATLLLPKPV